MFESYTCICKAFLSKVGKELRACEILVPEIEHAVMNG